uniref:Uncharacterized protein n=1 Tax=Arundo donax TaxID=35708 RepID=A0A0A9D3A8_ARUDO
MNPTGVAVDLARLAELVDAYGEELRKRTEGLGAESELLGFMNALEGQWGSRRRRRKFVDAGMFGDHLPRVWKLLLGLKRKEHVAWINCRRYPQRTSVCDMQRSIFLSHVSSGISRGKANCHSE